MADWLGDLFPKPRRTFSQAQRENMRRFQGNKCSGCGRRLNGHAEADHAIPFAYGGPTQEYNGQMLCPSCHKRKTAAQNRKSFW